MPLFARRDGEGEYIPTTPRHRKLLPAHVVAIRQAWWLRLSELGLSLREVALIAGHAPSTVQSGIEAARIARALQATQGEARSEAEAE